MNVALLLESKPRLFACRLCCDFVASINPVQSPSGQSALGISDVEDIVAVFVTDVAGVYDRPPNQPGAKLLSDILVQPDGSVRFC